MALRPNVKLLPFQVEGVNFALKHNYSINAMEQGLGKTLQAIAVQQATDLDCVVICPSTLKLGWKEEYEKFTDIDLSTVKVGIKKSKVNIVHYEDIYKCSELIRKAGIVIIDEAHYLIHLDSQRTTYVHRMIKKYTPERLIMLTGTPIKNRVSDFFSLLMLTSYSPIKNNGTLITDKFKTQEAYNNFFCNSYKMKVTVRPKNKKPFKTEVTRYSGIRNQDILQDYMKFKLIRRLAKNVLDLPEMIFKDVVVSYKKNTELEVAFNQFLKGESYNSSVKKQAALSVAPFTAKYVKDIIKSGEGPVVVFSDHPETLDIIEKDLRKAKIASGKITGATSKTRDRDRIAFQNGKLDVLLCTSGAGAEGLNLTISRNMVLNDIPWDHSKFYQLLKRIHRIGQLSKCVVHRMVGTVVYKKIIKSLCEKAEEIKLALGE